MRLSVLLDECIKRTIQGNEYHVNKPKVPEISLCLQTY